MQRVMSLGQAIISPHVPPKEREIHTQALNNDNLFFLGTKEEEYIERKRRGGGSRQQPEAT